MEFRPSEIGQLFGQEHLWDVLEKWTTDPTKIPQSLLLSGPWGCGKTSIARIIANKLCTVDTDITEINAAEARGIDDVRAWTESTRFSPFGKAKVYIIDELHQMTNAAQSALLKVIEEPPKSIYFILCTTEPSKLLGAIRSRCVPLEVKILTVDATGELLNFAFGAQFTPELIQRIHQISGGHARDAIKIASTRVLGENLNHKQFDSVFPTDLIPLISEVIKGDRAALEKLSSYGDLQGLAQEVDRILDQGLLQGNEQIARSYTELLQFRVYRKEYKITVLEQLNHVFSKMKPQYRGL